MPDWSYHTLFKPILKHTPPKMAREFIHKGMNMLASLPGGEFLIRFLGHMSCSTSVQVQQNGHTYASPIGLSGKVDPHLSGTKAFFNLGFSIIEIGPVTLHEKTAVQKPHYNIQEDRISFPIDLESIGLQKTIKKLRALKGYSHKKLIRVKGTNEEILTILQSVKQYSDQFVLETNAVPSTTFLKQLNDELDHPPLLALPLPVLNQTIRTVTSLCKENLIDGVLIDEENGFTSHRQQLLKIKQMVKCIRSQLEDSGIIIVTGAVTEPKDALNLIKAGTDIILLSGGYIQSGPGLPKRINEALYNKISPNNTESSGWIWYWLFGFFILLGGILALLFSVSTVLLPYDESFLGISRNEILDFNARLFLFMAHDRITLAGTMISGGFLYMQLASHGIRWKLHWARKATNIAAIIGFLGILLFIGFGYFDWLHGLFWLILLPLFITGYVKTKDVTDTPRSSNLVNDKAWKKSLYGQLAMVSLGFSFMLGGIVISYIGTTNVFVDTDIGYLCIPPEAIQSFNEKLIPVIAHDRAGFGSALLSVGLLVLMISLWGYHEGARWVWWTITLGGIPAFSAGIITHFVIGYTTFTHLIPAYVALLLYCIGCYFSYFYLIKRHNENEAVS